jgi:geranylgeranyl reductase family protein
MCIEPNALRDVVSKIEAILMKTQYDCIVVGGGPAGSTVASLVAEAGFSTLLLEREKMPRFHVGESLMPETYWTFKRLGVLDKMKSSTFVRKLSVQFVSSSGAESDPFFFRRHDDRECSQTWQVERGKFDHMLFQHAAEKGADVHDETRVQEILLEGTRATGVRLEADTKTPQEIHARVVVDATGQQALLANRLGLRVENPKLKKAAIWNYYRGAERAAGDNGGATIILHTQSKQAWFWFIPLADDITSVGVVADRDYLLKNRGKPESVFQEELSQCPALVRRLENAEITSDYRVAREFSYTTKQHAGDGWVLVGDAWGFIDPVYSSGVYFALKSGELAGDAIVAGLRSGDTSATQLASWTEEFEEGVRWVRQLVHAFYTNDFSFGRFLKEHPEHVSNLTDLLIGRVFYEGAGRIFDDMQPQLQKVASNASS